MRILLQESGPSLQMTLMDEGGDTSFDTIVDRSKLRKELIAEFIFEWTKGYLRPVFEAMPMAAVQILIPKDSSDELNMAAMRLGGMLLATNEFMAQVQPLTGKTADRTLFVNVSDDLRYRSLFDKISNESWTYLNHQLGFDRRTRVWGRTDPPMPPRDFVDYLVAGGFGRVIIVNTYLVENYLGSHGIWLPALLDRLGISLIIIDNDPHDLLVWGFLKRTALMNGAPRFSNLSILNEWADSAFPGPAPVYGVIPQDYDGPESEGLRDDYSVVVLSNSRLDLVNSLRPQMEFLKSVFPQKDIFREFQAWYLALRRRILRAEMPIAEKLAKNHHLHMVFYTFLQEMKYWVVSSISTSRKVDVYGDTGWGELFPSYYRRSLDNREIEELFSRGNQLFLLVNLSFNYLDASGPVYDMQRHRVPWLNMVPMVASPAFAALRDLEYDNNTEELGWKLDNAQRIWAHPAVQEALGTYRQVLASSVENIRNVLAGKSQNGAFAGHLAEHRSLVEAKIDDYEARSCDFIDFTARELLGD